MAQQARDVVCGMNVDPDTAVSTVFEGTTYYFCCGGCKRSFEKNPGKYLDAGSAESHHTDHN